MKKNILKVLSVVLAVVLLFSVTLPAYAAVDTDISKNQIPIIRMYGDGTELYDKDGNELSRLTRFFGNKGSAAEGDNDGAEILKSVANVLMPFLIDGIAFNNWEPYYENLQKEISEMFGDILLDENGEASNGSGLGEYLVRQNEYHKTTDVKGSKGYYSPYDYTFWYDWRLDPWETAAELNDYIKAVKAVTHSDKISIVANCLGTNVAMAYIARYGTEDIHGIGLDASVSNGIEPLSEAISGKFKIDGDGIYRVLKDANDAGTFSIDSFILTTIELAEKSGAIDAVVGVTKKLLYERLVKGVTSALTLGTIVSFPCYWACVSVKEFDTAVNYVFGDEGSEKRETYAGLIEKITNYNENVKKRIPDMIREMAESDDVKLGIISKYGFQLLPICESRYAIADTFVSVESSSFGATTGTIYETLSDEYISKQTEKGLDKYISPDKQIDASTCICPDYTWFLKGVKHSYSSDAEIKLLATIVTADKQYTVDDFDMGQFMLLENEKLVAMTEENCNTESWNANHKEDHPSNRFEKLYVFLKALFKWFGELGKFLSPKTDANA